MTALPTARLLTNELRGLRTVSLRRRVTWLGLAVLFAVLVATVVAVSIAFTVESNRDVTSVLNDRMQIAKALARTNISPSTLVTRIDTGGIRVRLVLADGTSYGSLDSKELADSPDASRTSTLVSKNFKLEGAQLTLQADSEVLSAAQSRLRRLLLIIGLCALVVTGGVLLITVRLALAPLDKMTKLARAIASGGRGGRLWPTRTDTELGRTAAAFDDMLDALEGAESQARRAEAAATEAADRTKRFVADAAHELRTPIAGVAAVAEAVLQQPQDVDPEERQRLHLLLIRESRRASQLVSDLLDLARIDAGVELERAPVGLRLLVDTQADRIRLLAPELTVRVVGSDLTVFGDAARITQVLANLLDNARQATPDDGRVSIQLASYDGFAEVLIMDSGHGVPSADRERIFDRLVRLDQARDRRSGGSGLGLAIARGFARAHGGDLTCEASPAGVPGATFRLLLPLDQRTWTDPPTERFPIPA